MDQFESRLGEESCPTHEDLRAFAASELPIAALKAVAHHVDACPQCFAFVGTLGNDDVATRRERRPAGRELAASPVTNDPANRPVDSEANTLLSADRKSASGEDCPGEPMLPFALGQYQLVEKIGQGGMGAVYRAVHLRLKKECAVKVLRPEFTTDPRAVDRFDREMQAIGRLDHHNIVRATDAGDVRGLHFLVMEFVSGIDLHRLVRRRGPLSVSDAAELVRQAAVGLQCAHENGMVHRDIKPSNLVLSTKGEVKVLDLGLALLHTKGPSSGGLTVHGQMMGTPDYTAPEQWEASHAVDIRADIYSLGCTLYTLLVGRPPFASPDAPMWHKMVAHFGEPIAPLSAQRTDVPPSLEQLLTKMVAKSPADRPSTPAEVALALEPFAQGANLPALASQALSEKSDPGSPLSAEPTVSRDHTPAADASPPLSPTPSRANPRRKNLKFLGAAGVGALAAILTATVALGLHALANSWGHAKPATTAALPGRWQNLLAAPPGQRLLGAGLTSEVKHDPTKQLLRFESSDPALIPLGSTDAQAFRLQVGFSQPRWVGGIGIYFGGREGPPPEVFRFQLIDLRPMGLSNGPPFQVTRSTGAIIQKPNRGPKLSTHLFAHWQLSAPLDNSEQLLALDVKPRGLVRVNWNGELCPELVADAANELGKAVGDQGEFGVYCIGSSGTVMTARFLPAE